MVLVAGSFDFLVASIGNQIPFTSDHDSLLYMYRVYVHVFMSQTAGESWRFCTMVVALIVPSSLLCFSDEHIPHSLQSPRTVTTGNQSYSSETTVTDLVGLNLRPVIALYINAHRTSLHCPYHSQAIHSSILYILACIKTYHLSSGYQAIAFTCFQLWQDRDQTIQI